MKKLKLDEPKKEISHSSYTVSYPFNKYHPNPEYPFKDTRLQFQSHENIYKPTLLETIMVLLISILLAAIPVILIFIIEKLG